MKKHFQLLLVVSLTLLLYACNQEPHTSYKITGQIQTVEISLPEGSDDLPQVDENPVEWGSGKVIVTQEITNAAGDIELVELTSGTFDNGTVNLNGRIDQPTEVRISVETEGAEPLTLNAVIAPETNISFRLVEYPTSASMSFYGASRSVLNPANRFSISGDLSGIDADLERATIEVSSWEHDEIGEDVTFDFGKVLLEDGKFVIEAEVDEPKFINVLVVLPVVQEYTQFNAIIEPGVEMEIVANSSWLHDLTAITGSGKHAQLVESWSQSAEYLALAQEYRVAYQAYRDKTRDDGDATDTAQEDKYRELGRKLIRMRSASLEDIASNAEDPIDALLALELGAYWGKEEALPVYDRLADSLDEDLVARRVTHSRNSHASNLARRGIDGSLVVGKSAPDFTLSNLAGEQISLAALQQKNEFVLVEFWASWCGPCIGAIPALKDLYSSYNLHGFEIVSISLDDNRDPWVEASAAYKLPWVNLGELKGFDGDVATSYGVTFIPKNYLVNTQGEIVEKDLTTEKLDEWLAKEYKENADSHSVEKE